MQRDPKRDPKLRHILHFLTMVAMPARILHLIFAEPGKNNETVASSLVLVGGWLWAQMLVAVGFGDWVTYVWVGTPASLILWVRVMYPFKKLGYE